MERENWRNVGKIKKWEERGEHILSFFYEHLTDFYQENDSLKKRKMIEYSMVMVKKIE